MTALLLLRHGQSTWNAERRWQGWADAPLSELGEQQARDAAEHLANAGLTVAVSSDLVRARRTAEIVAAALGIGLRAPEPDLRERDVGLWTGLTIPEIEARWPDELAAHRAGRLQRQPEGEDTTTLLKRATNALARIAVDHAGDVPLVVTHGGVIRSLERATGADPPAATPNLGGRWFVWTGEGFEPGDLVALVDPTLKTAPPSR
jgi:probable phosphoglycerate mutase